MAESVNERIADRTERIAERTERANERLKEQGFFGRMMNRAGLHTANATDRAAAVGDNKGSHLLGGAVFGAMRGAVLGTVAWMVLVAAGFTSLAMLGGYLAVAGIAAAGYGLYHGQKSVQHYEQHRNDKRLADHIAEKSGATYDRRLTEPIMAPGEEQQRATGGHVARENARRQAAATGRAV